MNMKAKCRTLRSAVALCTALTALPVIAAAAESAASYPLGICPISGRALSAGDESVAVEHGGRQVRFCSEGCRGAFEADPEKYLKEIDAKIVEQQKPYYPLDTCPISGGQLGAMGGPIDYVHMNRLVRFCCEGCINSFLKDADKHLAELDKAVIEKQKADYPLTVCPVMGSQLKPEKAVDYVFGNRLVRFCCASCIKDLEKEPAKYLSMLDQAIAQEKASEPADTAKHP